MKVNRFATVMLFAIMMSVFFACSDSSPTSPGDNPSSGSNGAVDINSKVYHLQCNPSDESCSLDTPYNGSGKVRGVFLGEFLDDDSQQVLGTMDMGMVNNGEINLEFPTPEEKFLKKDFEIRLYQNEVFIGRLFPLAANFSRDNNLIAMYYYFPEDYQNKDTTDISQEHGVIFIDDVDVRMGWNLVYEKDEFKIIDGKEVQTVIHTSDAGILNGIKLKWFLLAPEMH